LLLVNGRFQMLICSSAFVFFCPGGVNTCSHIKASSKIERNDHGYIPSFLLLQITCMETGQTHWISALELEQYVTSYTGQHGCGYLPVFECCSAHCLILFFKPVSLLFKSSPALTLAGNFSETTSSYFS